MIVIRTCIIPSWRTISIFRNVSRSRIFAWGGNILGHVFCLKAFRPNMLLVKVDWKVLRRCLVTLNFRPSSSNFALIWLCVYSVRFSFPLVELSRPQANIPWQWESRQILPYSVCHEQVFGECFVALAPISSRFVCPRPPLLLCAPNQNRHATKARWVSAENPFAPFLSLKASFYPLYLSFI